MKSSIGLIAFVVISLTNPSCRKDSASAPTLTSSTTPQFAGRTSSDEGDSNPSSQPSLTSCYKGDVWSCTVEAAIVRETNLLRNSDNPLTQSFESSYIARLWSASQSESGQISHEGFPSERHEVLVGAFPKADWDFVAENVAMLQSSDSDAAKIAKQFVTMWKKSPGHYENMTGDYNYLGTGVARVGNTYYGTQIFH